MFYLQEYFCSRQSLHGSEQTARQGAERCRNGRTGKDFSSKGADSGYRERGFC